MAIYRQQLADEEREKAVAEAVTAAEERHAAQQEQDEERKNKRERRNAITTATGMTVNSEIFYGGVTGMAILAAAVVVLSVAGSRRRKALLRKLDKLFFAIPQSISDNSTEVQTSIMALVNNKNRGSDEFKATLDKCAHGACTLSAEIAFINTVHAIIVNEGKAEYEECDADKIMKQCRTNLLGLAALRNINIDYKSTGSCMVRCDEHSVKVMMNMAIADAMEDVRTGGKVSLWIETEGSSITLAVEDDGDSSLFVLDETKSDDDNHDKWKEMHRTGYMRIAERNGAKFVERRKKSGGHIRGILFNQK